MQIIKKQKAMEWGLLFLVAESQGYVDLSVQHKTRGAAIENGMWTHCNQYSRLIRNWRFFYQNYFDNHLSTAKCAKKCNRFDCMRLKRKKPRSQLSVTTFSPVGRDKVIAINDNEPKAIVIDYVP